MIENINTMGTVVKNVGVNSSEFSSFNDNYSSILTEFLTDTANHTSNERRDSLYVVIPITIIYVAIFFTGLIGNVSTCVVIAKNRSMHTATNYYLFSLAISDLLLLVSGLPPEMYYIWSHFPYVFGEAFCIIQSFAAETSANATVLTITAFTVERYVAICHPFLSHTMSKLSRAVKYVILIWILALCLAIPQAIQFGVVYSLEMNGTTIPDTAMCSVKWAIIEHAFEISTILFFVGPMTIITVLYILIGIKLRHSRLLTAVKRNPFPSCLNHVDSGRSRGLAQRNVIRMLVAVVVAFFICWAPFHAQRLLAVYAKSTGDEPHAILITVYTVLTYISGIFYYVSTTVNPLLYNIMSNKFREAFKTMLADNCRSRRSLQKATTKRQTYSSLYRYPKSPIKRDEHKSGSSASDDNQRLAMQQMREHTIVSHNQQSTIDCTSEHWKTSDRRKSSQYSESILVTSLAKGLNEACNNNGGVSHVVNKYTTSDPKQLRPVTIGILAERFKCGTKGLFTHQQARESKVVNNNDDTVRSHVKIQNHSSIESANTISNSSLQDLDNSEFIDTELAIYMGEINCDLVS